MSGWNSLVLKFEVSDTTSSATLKQIGEPLSQLMSAPSTTSSTSSNNEFVCKEDERAPAHKTSPKELGVSLTKTMAATTQIAKIK